jgi:hypothetical protein
MELFVMNRRHFLSTTGLAGFGLAAFATSARALSVQDCTADPNSAVCSEVARHDNIRAQLEALLKDEGLSEEQRKVALAAAICPFCGQPLLG